MNKIIIMITMSIFMFVGCGGGGGSDGTPTVTVDRTQNNRFTLKVGNIQTDTDSTISGRLTSRFYEGITEIETISMSKNGTITLEGKDANLFKLVNNKILFKQPAKVGTYEVDIKAVKNSKSIVLKRSYEILQGLKSLMSQKSFYIVGYRPSAGDDFINHVTYNKDFNASTGEITQGPNIGQHGTYTFVFDGEKRLTYPDGKFVELGEVTDDYLVMKTHLNDGVIIDERFYFDEKKAKQYYDEISKTVKSIYIDENDDAFRAAKIKEFSVKGSEKQENGKVILGNEIEMHVKLDGISTSGNVLKFAIFNSRLDWHGQNLDILNSQIDTEYKINCTVDASNQKKYGCQVQTKDSISDEWKAIEGIGIMDATQIPTLVNISAIGIFSCEDNATNADCHRAIVPARLDVLKVNNSTTVNDGMVYDVNVSKDFTVSVWAKPSSVEDNVLITFPSLNRTEFHWVLNASNSYIIEASSGIHNGTSIGGTVLVNNWKMYTLTKQGNETKFYEDGIFVKSIADMSYGLNFVWITLGGHKGIQHNYRGLIDNIIIDDIALTPEQINKLHSQTIHTN